MSKRLLISLCLVAGILSGCGGNTANDAEVVLATVGEKPITLADVKRDIRLMSTKPTLETLDQKKEFLKDIINKELMLAGSYEILPELTEQMTWRMTSFRKQMLREMLTDHKVRPFARVSENDIQEAYAHMQRDVYLDGMLLIDEGTAQEMRRRIDDGESFEELCVDYSIWDSGKPEEPWDLGWSSAGQLPNWDMEVAAWNANPGDFVGPYKDSRGWWVLRVGDSRTIPAEAELEVLRPRLQEMVQKPRHLMRSEALNDSLFAAADITYPQEGTLALLEAFTWDVPEAFQDDPYAKFNAPRDIPKVDEETGKIPAVVFGDGRVWDIQEYLDRTHWYASGIWPVGYSVEDLMNFNRIMIREYLQEEASRHYGLDKLDEYALRIRENEEEIRVRYVYRTLVQRIELTEEEIMEWFNANRDRYMSPPSYRMAFFSSADHDAMNALRDKWIGGAGFVELREEYELSVDDLIYVGDSSWLHEGTDTRIDDHLAQVEVGDIAPIYMFEGKAFVIRLLDRRGQLHVLYEDAKEFVDQDARTNTKEQTMQKFLETQRTKTPVVVFDDALDKAAIVPAALAAK